MGKGEIARYEQFLLFSQFFQKACFPGASKGVIVWEWVNPLVGKATDWHFMDSIDQHNTTQSVLSNVGLYYGIRRYLSPKIHLK